MHGIKVEVDKRKCKEVCSEQEYIALEKAFFDKESSLKK